jgi:Domain of unknown function (DUF4386)
MIRTARVTGVFYLGVAISGGLSFLVIRPILVDNGEPAATFATLATHESLARVGIALEMVAVLTQALAAVWFFRLFRAVDSVNAGSIAAFGLVNAVIVLGSAAAHATALDVAHDAGAASSVRLLYGLSDNLWGVGSLFFGLWLIPMGICVVRSAWMPRALGWVLVAAGVCYIVGAFTMYLVPSADALTQALAVPSAIGEFWMLGYLLVLGVRRSALSQMAPA